MRRRAAATLWAAALPALPGPRQAPVLARAGLRVLAIDLRGHGRSHAGSGALVGESLPYPVHGGNGGTR